jgi:hypothetical protein
MPRAVVVSDRLWRSRFGSDPGIVGRSIRIDGGSVPIVGVMPADFDPMSGSPFRSPSERTRSAFAWRSAPRRAEY